MDIFVLDGASSWEALRESGLADDTAINAKLYEQSCRESPHDSASCALPLACSRRPPPGGAACVSQGADDKGRERSARKQKLTHEPDTPQGHRPKLASPSLKGTWFELPPEHELAVTTNLSRKDPRYH